MTTHTGAKLRVAVVDDSTFIRKAILRIFEDEPYIEVVGSAASGEELMTHIERWRPDVITLDLDMPGMGGLETLDHIRAVRPTPVIILSTHSGEGAPQTIEALHRGAADFIDKQRYSLVDFEALRTALVDKIFQVTGRTPRRRPSGREDDAARPESEQKFRKSRTPKDRIPGDRAAAGQIPAGRPLAGRPPAGRPSDSYDLIAIGASTGGPPILQEILESIGDSVPVPIVVVQHMPVGFTGAFAERLNAYLPLQVRETQAAELLAANSVYIARAGFHLRIRRQEADLYAEITDRSERQYHKPSIDVLFDSAAKTTGRRTVAALLSGMGRDGAKGLASLKIKGAYTFIQDESSCIVFGMPRAALALDAVTEVAPPREMGRRMRQLVLGTRA